ncbi:hypothetical protein SAMN05192544_103344 [Paraburkholderia hospita]|uniref:Uncharacterized protein n=1 Tax=Paraburkholderia hospita TaxID=169430 RepID=A0AAN1JND1_9BURK|nr:hypothetical protein C2L64_52475 [Paraburkholderia hospita]SEI18955.1 hypothetical protein SAMN05192544_103344 [Paraburkholderia hospita]
MRGLQSAAGVVCISARGGTVATVVVHRQAQAAVVAEQLDLDAYIDGFLGDPQPAGCWIGQGKAERFDPAWRPFTKLLPESSREIVRKLLSAMYGWLVRQQYLLVNPAQGLAKVGNTAADHQPAGSDASRV